MTTYTTRNEAIDREIIQPLGEYADQFDIDAIADQVLVSVGEGIDYKFTTNDDVDFWDVVAQHEI
ncbi:hypothetical protein QP916_03690 [Corynebacterium accolens]|uniref:hypothetical protein n=1 Tax=Corynebacterium accolens TaxID=38284 RepID=UPI0025507464|nr:hypothetical protein [Corynebacterium accolens]MDK8497768.1 hypothetical protein [Corynebacterium accolens]HDM2782266.1 hypothetical protein [Staphylococcus aureus]